MTNRTRNIVVVAIVAIAMLLVVVLVAGARSDASKSASAAEDVAEVLNRRSPILDYLECSFGRVGDYVAASTALRDAQAAGADTAGPLVTLRDKQTALADIGKPVEAGGCGAPPKPPGG